MSDPRTDDPNRALLAMYAEVCSSHRAITEFRAKLLALLPISSVAAIILVGSINQTPPGGLVAFGIFGALVTVGLFMYELRQIDVCKQLRNHATWLERELAVRAGQFGGRRGHMRWSQVFGSGSRKRDAALAEDELAGRPHTDGDGGMIGAESAGLVVYTTVAGAWVAVIAVGIFELISDFLEILP